MTRRLFVPILLNGGSLPGSCPFAPTLGSDPYCDTTFPHPSCEHLAPISIVRCPSSAGNVLPGCPLQSLQPEDSPAPACPSPARPPPRWSRWEPALRARHCEG